MFSSKSQRPGRYRPLKRKTSLSMLVDRKSKEEGTMEREGEDGNERKVKRIEGLIKERK